MFDFSEYRLRQLNPDDGVKPLDFGNAGTTGSVKSDGRLIAVNTYHPAHGYMTLSSVAPFPDDQRYDASRVRAYRQSIADNDGFGITFDVDVVERAAFLIEDAIPLLRLQLANGVRAEVITFVTHRDPVGMMQIWHFSERGDWAHFSGNLWLQRSAYTQLTEGGVLPAPDPTTRVAGSFDDGHSLLQNDAMTAYCHLYPAYFTPVGDGSLRPMPVDLFALEQDSDAHTLIVHIGLDFNRSNALARFQATSPERAHELLLESLDYWRDLWQATTISDDLLSRRALSYGLRCCVPVTADALCILTDHMLLPLSWTRDSFYVAQALLTHLPQGDAIVRQHLCWLFERAERTDGIWGRAYLANGVVKDRGFQLDQQLYPLLELAHYIRLTGDDTLARYGNAARSVIDALLARRDPDCGLIATDETPADDPIALPYHFSSHVLLWRVLILAADLFDEPSYADLAGDVWQKVTTHFVVDHDGGALYTYASDGAGAHHLYHDANDIPLALMPLWGCCTVDDPLWLATIRFAWSEANVGGYYDGQLGSVHTPAAWPLGAAQMLLIAQQRDDEAGVEAVLNLLRQAAQWDGALPEANDPRTFAVRSRHWFAWPNAMLIYREEKTE